MPEKSKYDRAIFPPGKQKEFIQRALIIASMSDISEMCKCSERTVRSWKNEKHAMNRFALDQICKHTSLPTPNSVLFVDRYAHTSRAGKRGAEVTLRKYGTIPVEESERKLAWRRWWNEKGKYENHPIINQPLEINRPPRSTKLAEMVGIILGDGGISDYQVTVTLHSIDDKQYGTFVTRLAKELFSVPVSISKSKYDTSTNYVISRKELVNFLTNKVGLSKGNKIRQQVDIPNWIKRSKQYSTACIRGLMDTDGGIVNHQYTVNGKTYLYKKLSFCSRSRPLLKSMKDVLDKLHIKTRKYKADKLWIDSKEDVKRYFDVVSSHNPKHLKRYSE